MFFLAECIAASAAETRLRRYLGAALTAEAPGRLGWGQAGVPRGLPFSKSWVPDHGIGGQAALREPAAQVVFGNRALRLTL